VLAYVGMLSMITDFFIIPRLMARSANPAQQAQSELDFSLRGALLVGAGLASSSLAPSFNWFLGAMAILALGTSMFRSTISSIITKVCHRLRRHCSTDAIDCVDTALLMP
jgi:hypothetical protein